MISNDSSTSEMRPSTPMAFPVVLKVSKIGPDRDPQMTPRNGN
jgi:hypothetical protein